MNPISLVISDVDGTLVTKDKRLVQANIRAVERLTEQGIGFAITSSRPPFGMQMLIAPLKLSLPMGAFNGSSIVDHELRVIEQHFIPKDAVQDAIAVLQKRMIDIWLFTNERWLVQRVDKKYVPHENRTTETEPIIVSDFEAFTGSACKIVGVSDDFDRLAQCEGLMKDVVGERAQASRSQNYYLDVTPPGFDKGTFVTAMAKRLNILPGQIATIGDMQNDLAMFLKSGLSFAMGNATDDVKAKATHVTSSNEEEGFARAIDLILAGSSSF